MVDVTGVPAIPPQVAAELAIVDRIRGAATPILSKRAIALLSPSRIATIGALANVKR